MRIEHLTEEQQKKKKHLDHETTETLTAQVKYVHTCTYIHSSNIYQFSSPLFSRALCKGIDLQQRNLQ